MRTLSSGSVSVVNCEQGQPKYPRTPVSFFQPMAYRYDRSPGGTGGWKAMTGKQALDFLGFLRGNYHRVATQVDVQLMPPELLDEHIKRNSPARPLMAATWFARQGYFISTWSLWEYYSRGFCERLSVKLRKERNESHVRWLARSLAQNNIPFQRHDWFSGAGALRNLIAHYSCSLAEPRAEKLMEAARAAFPKLDRYADNYAIIELDHVNELAFEVEEFVRDTVQALPD